MLNKVKLALRIVTNTFDDQLNMLICAAIKDLEIAGVRYIDTNDPIISQAIITYCRLHFGEPNNPERLKQSYDEQKAQLKTSSEYGEIYG